jgi:hypothetical protein
MPYTRAWDETFPPDTQAAKLLGQDIREFKEDVSERLASFGTGTLANRPTPEAVFGIAGNGVLYYAHDVGVLFQWDGAGWTAVKYDGTFSDPTVATLVTPTVETPTNTATVPAGSIAYGARIDIYTAVRTLSAGSHTLSLYIQSAAPIFQVSWATADLAFIRASIIILPNDTYVGWFSAAVGAVGNVQSKPPQAFNIALDAAFGSTIIASAGNAESQGMIVSVDL